MYTSLRKLLFFLKPEAAHALSMFALKAATSVSFSKKLVAGVFRNGGESRTAFGLKFRNIIGLAAGFDKNARYLEALDALGFGFVEIGTVTPKPQTGNAKPRLFRLPKDRALINRMGFNNDGVTKVAKRLQQWRQRHAGTSLLIGGNIGKNKVTVNEDAWKDYEICFTALHQYVDFFVVNVSSPNTPGLRELQEKDALHKILVHLQQLNKKYGTPKPILLKIAPDLNWQQIDDVIELANEIHLDGLVATNTTISRDNLISDKEVVAIIGAGGLSGLPMKQRSTDIIRYVHEKTNGTLPIIGSGGVFTAADADEKLKAGATLIEVWTGFIYEGPAIVKKILSGLRTAGRS